MMDELVQVEIIAYAPTAFYHCMHCEVAWREMGVTNHIHEEQVENSLPPDLAQDYQAISDWVRKLLKCYCDRVTVKVIDAASLEGVWKSLRYNVHRYPAVIVNHKQRYMEDALQRAGEEIDVLLGQVALQGKEV